MSRVARTVALITLIACAAAAMMIYGLTSVAEPRDPSPVCGKQWDDDMRFVEVCE